MKTFIGILLVGLLGFSGCSSSDAESIPAYNVQAIGMVNGSELSVSAIVMDQEEQLSYDAMITINGEPMNIGFFAAEDLLIVQNDSVHDANNRTVDAVPNRDFQPYYFLDSFDLNEVDTVNFLATGKQGTTLFTCSNKVPEKLTLIEPSSDATFLTGQEVYIRWEGGEPNTCFQVLYYGGSDDVIHTTGWLDDTLDYTIPAGVIEPGPLFIDVTARRCSETTHSFNPESGECILEVTEGDVWWVDNVVETSAEMVKLRMAGSKYGRCAAGAQTKWRHCRSGCPTYQADSTGYVKCAGRCNDMLRYVNQRCRERFCNLCE